MTGPPAAPGPSLPGPPSGGFQLVVRRVRDGEYEAVGALTVLAYRQVLGDTLGPSYEAQLADAAARDAHCPVLVAVEGSQVLGAVTYVPGPGSPYAEFDDPDAAAIRHLAVLPRAQGRGVARALLDAAVDRARRDGRQRMVLHSTAPMVRAQHLYLRSGFRRAPELDWTNSHVMLFGYKLDLLPSLRRAVSGD